MGIGIVRRSSRSLRPQARGTPYWADRVLGAPLRTEGLRGRLAFVGEPGCCFLDRLLLPKKLDLPPQPLEL